MTDKDLSDWRGIGTGYLVLLCLAFAFGAIFLMPPGLDRWDQRGAFALLLMLLYGAWAVVKRPVRGLVEGWAGGSRHRHEGLKNAAVAAMCLVSAALCAAGVPLAWTHSW